MKYSYETLPDGYKECLTVDLKKNKKLALIVNLAAAVIAVLMIIPAALLVPLYKLYSMEDGIGMYLLRFAVLFAGSVLYIVFHELTHGVFIRIFSKKRPYYGFNGLYAFAGSRDYLAKMPYLVVALAPVVIWGCILAGALLFIPESWFWVVYFIQIFNFSGAAGDFYVTLRFLSLPADLLVKDVGVAMTVYSRE